MSASLVELAELVRRECGIEFGPAQFASLEAAVGRLEPGMTPERLLAGGRSEATIRQLINEVTIRETFFFRHRRELGTIDWRRSLDAARARGSDVVRVWVAACASGEEAYSLAILACEAFSSATPPVQVLATDVATAALAQAQDGRYGPRSAAAVGEAERRRYFTVQGDLLCVGERVRALVEFRRQNLVRDLAPTDARGGFDVISCRNVLIYFDPPTVAQVMRSLQSALAPGGMLVLGAADALSGRPGVPVASAADRRARPAISARSPQVAAAPAASSAATKAASPTVRGRREALAAVDQGELDLGLEIIAETLARDPLEADAYYVRGLIELAHKEPRAALGSLRRAVYIDPDFSPALFNLARAHDALGSSEGARQAYERTLRSLARYAQAPHELGHSVDLADIAVACHSRLTAIATARQPVSHRAALPNRG
jgi:chemotaxis protein methyltransferase CheR